MTVKPPLIISSQWPLFWWTVHTLTLVSTSLQRSLSSVPKVAIADRFNCIINHYKLSNMTFTSNQGFQNWYVYITNLLCSVSGALDCRVGCQGFDSQGQTNTQGSEITEKWRCHFCLCGLNDYVKWRSRFQ